MTKLTRRALLGTIGAATAAAAFPMPVIAADRSIRHYWWGNPERDKRTFAVIDTFQKKNPGIEVSGETIGWGDYWTKMATQTAGRNMADLVQMDYRFLFEYVHRGALKPLDEFAGKSLMIADFDQGPLDGGKVDGKLYALNIGSNSQVMVHNTRAFQEAGIDVDLINWTWDDFSKTCEAITSKSGGKMKGSDDLSLMIEAFEAWVRQNGREFYGPEGKVTATAEDVSGWWQFWADLRKADVVRDKNKTVILDPPIAESGVPVGDTAMSHFWSNQLVGIQAVSKDKIGAAMIPHKAGGKQGQFIKPSMFLSLTRDAKDTEAAIAYMNAWVNDPEITGILGLERGIPCSPKVRAALAPKLTEVEKLSVDYFDAIQSKVGPLPLPAPKGAGEVRDAFMRTGTDVVLGKMEVAEAAGMFIQDAQDIVDRAQ
ncbi:MULTISPECIES: extracellular solute-binding protein [Rhizobium/Agrobacterium group]|uniref:Extracellular solute-binding protein n=2 Tax=Neorhizobium TaxID=1525371 RepID=A0ABV0LYU7_9HYPH|nr:MULTISPECIES: extracellular solute-binding protein [Rhizobium/Agrobacterium group]KGD87620.1 sugar ABC transporter [Rhizobium sp. YS-1r]MCC2612290.1 extracellular solute-binding protein [Neorhizobium petrolearium]WGI67432.1 extracellular solute-binding protein [Neorhizobium petrolearium]